MDVRFPCVFLQYRGSRLWVDGSAIDIKQFQLGGLVQVLGEFKKFDRELPLGNDRPIVKALLQARIIRPVDGLDMQLYERCLEVRRQFEAKYCPENMEAGGQA